jgi:hypothetical protein
MQLQRAQLPDAACVWPHCGANVCLGCLEQLATRVRGSGPGTASAAVVHARVHTMHFTALHQTAIGGHGTQVHARPPSATYRVRPSRSVDWSTLRRRHPTADRPLIDWDLIMVMEPMTILGAVLGGFLNKLLPVWQTTVLLTLLLAFMSYELWRKAGRLYQKESVALRERASQSSPAAGAGASQATVCRPRCCFDICMNTRA